MPVATSNCLHFGVHRDEADAVGDCDWRPYPRGQLALPEGRAICWIERHEHGRCRVRAAEGPARAVRGLRYRGQRRQRIDRGVFNNGRLRTAERIILAGNNGTSAGPR